MTGQGALLASAVLLLLGLAGLSAWLAWRARGAEAAMRRRARLLEAVSGAAGEVALAEQEPASSVAAALEAAGLTDTAVLVLDDASGSWRRWTDDEQPRTLTDPWLARVAQRAWDRRETVAEVPSGGDLGAIGCPIPVPGGVSAVLVARSEGAGIFRAERAAVEACAALLGASGLPAPPPLPERTADDRRARGPVDSLTGLVTASALLGPLQDRCQDPRAPVAMLLVGVDGVEAIGERLGGRSGDEVLRIAARRLQRCVRPDDILARLDPTVFGILLAAGTDPEGSVVVGERVREALSTPVAVTAGEVLVPVRVGLVWDASEISDAARLVPEARAALARSEGDVITTIRLGGASAAEQERRR